MREPTFGIGIHIPYTPIFRNVCLGEPPPGTNRFEVTLHPLGRMIGGVVLVGAVGITLAAVDALRESGFQHRVLQPLAGRYVGQKKQ